MNDDKRKQVKIILGVACLVGAVVVFFVFNNTFRVGVGGRDSDLVYVMCVNEECGAKQELTKEEFSELTSQINPRMINDTAFECSKCGQQTAYKANKCSKCGEIYLSGYDPDDFADRCPNCGFSAVEERRKKYKK